MAKKSAKKEKATVVPDNPTKANAPETKVVKPAVEKIPSGVLKVKAVIRDMYSPIDQLMIPETHGVLVKEGSWVACQIERGLLKIVE